MTTKQSAKATESTEKLFEQTSEIANKMAAAAVDTMETAAGIYGQASSSANSENLNDAARKGWDTYFAVSGAAWAGMEAFGAQLASYTNDSFAANLAFAKKGLTLKDPQEIAELQQAQVSTKVDQITSHAAKLNEIATGTAKKVLDLQAS